MRLSLSSNCVFKCVLKKKRGISCFFKRKYSLITSVNINNWDNIHKEILQKIRDCDFVSIDVEYTGLHLKDERYVSVDASYEAHCFGAKSFFPCQIGLTIAKKIDSYHEEAGTNENKNENKNEEEKETKRDNTWSEENKKLFNETNKCQRWEIAPYSIYVFPKENKYFSVSTTTLIFLRENNFDFNEWIFKGVSYLTPSEENEKKKFLLEKKEELQNLLHKCNTQNKKEEKRMDIKAIIDDIQNNKIVDEEDKEPIIEIIKKIDVWFNKGSNTRKNGYNTNVHTNLTKNEFSSNFKGVNVDVEGGDKPLNEMKKETHLNDINFCSEKEGEREFLQADNKSGDSKELLHQIGEEHENDKENDSSISKEANTDDLPLYIEIENPYLRLLAHTLITKYFDFLFCVSVKVNDKKHLAVYKTEKDTYKEQIRTVESEIEKINKTIGVRLLFDEIMNTKKIIIGHNCFYDILHIYQTFYNELPKSINEFKEKWTNFFSYTFDTKFMNETNEHLQALNGPATLKGLCEYMGSLISAKEKYIDFYFHFENGQSNLPQCFRSFIRPEKPIKKVYYATEETKSKGSDTAETGNKTGTKPEGGKDNENKYENDKERDNEALFKSDEHNAGYDSLLTCFLFIFQCYHILKNNNLRWSDIHFYKKNSRKDYRNDFNISPKTKGENKQRMQFKQNEYDDVAKRNFVEVFSNMANKIKLVKTQPNVISLTSNENSEMDRHFYMYDYPSYFKKWEIMKIWSPLWITLSKVDDQSCWIIAKSDEDAKNIKTIYKMLQNPQFKICTYEEYLQKFKNS